MTPDLESSQEETLEKTHQDCSICLEEMSSSLKKIACGHEFHKECIDRWIAENLHPECPICRSLIVEEQSWSQKFQLQAQLCCAKTLFFFFYFLGIFNLYLATSINDNLGLLWSLLTFCTFPNPKFMYMNGLLGGAYSTVQLYDLLYNDQLFAHIFEGRIDSLYFSSLFLQSFIMLVISIRHHSHLTLAV